MGKDIRISVRLSEKEKQTIQAKAKKCGLSASEYVKQRALGYEPRTVPLNAEIEKLLKEITAVLLLPGREKS